MVNAKNITLGLLVSFIINCTNSVKIKNNDTPVHKTEVAYEDSINLFEEKGSPKKLYYRENPFTGILIKHYLTATIKSKEQYKNGKLKGKSYYYDSLGNLIKINLYKDNRLKQKDDYNKEKTLISRTIRPNIFDSTSFVFKLLYENGKPFSVSYYENNYIVRYYQLFENGDTIIKTKYNDTGEIIFHKEYFSNGNLKRILNYQMNTAKFYHPNNRLNRELKLDINHYVISGKYNSYDIDGNKFPLIYKDGKCVSGEIIKYYFNGQKMSYYLFINNILKSKSEFNPDGSLITDKIIFDQGEEVIEKAYSSKKVLNTYKHGVLRKGYDITYYESGRKKSELSKDKKSEDLCRRIFHDFPNSPIATIIYFDEDDRATDVVYHNLFGELKISISKFYSEGKEIRKPKLKEYVYSSITNGEIEANPGWSWKSNDTIYVGTKRNLIFVAHTRPDPKTKYMTNYELEDGTPDMIDYIRNVFTGEVEVLNEKDIEEIERKIKIQLLEKSIPEENNCLDCDTDTEAPAE